MAKYIHDIIMGLLVLTAAFLTISDIFRVMEHPELEAKIPTITLACLGVVALYLVVERHRATDKIMKQLSKLESEQTDGRLNIIKSLDGVMVQTFRNEQQLLDHVVRRMSDAKTVYDITLRPSERWYNTKATQALFEKYVAAQQELIRKPDCEYREVLYFADKRMLTRVKELRKVGAYNYKCCYYKSISYAPPCLTFTLFDEEEVVIWAYRPPGKTERDIRLAIRHPDIINFFRDYYFAYWDNAASIDDLTNFDQCTLAEINRNNQSPSSP